MRLIDENAAVDAICSFHITGYESSDNWYSYQYSSDAPVDVTVFAKTKKDAIEKAEKIIGCPISTSHRRITAQEVRDAQNNGVEL